jgi:uncharacterized protein with gpF-like domain
MKQPLKDKTLVFEQDYIETEIKWNLKLGDKIFKKSDVRNAIQWLKDELQKKQKLDYKETSKLINIAFNDVIKR